MRAINATEPKIDVSFYIPCLNEEENISATLDTIFRAVKPFPFRFDIIVVDDGSEDRTLEILKQKPVDMIICGIYATFLLVTNIRM